MFEFLSITSQFRGSKDTLTYKCTETVDETLKELCEKYADTNPAYVENVKKYLACDKYAEATYVYTEPGEDNFEVFHCYRLDSYAHYQTCHIEMDDALRLTLKQDSESETVMAYRLYDYLTGNYMTYTEEHHTICCGGDDLHDDCFVFDSQVKLNKSSCVYNKYTVILPHPGDTDTVPCDLIQRDTHCALASAIYGTILDKADVMDNFKGSFLCFEINDRTLADLHVEYTFKECSECNKLCVKSTLLGRSNCPT